MTYSYAWHDSFMFGTWLIYMCDKTHPYVWHDSFVCVTWLIHMCDTTYSHESLGSFICVTWLIHTCDVTQLGLEWAGHVDRPMSHRNGGLQQKKQSTEICTMGWIRLVGSLKLQVSFAEYRLFYRALLQKRPIILWSLLIVATPYIIIQTYDVELHSRRHATYIAITYSEHRFIQSGVES